LLVALRLADGIFLGGEYAGATPLAMEAVPTGRRGWYGGLVGMGFPLSYCAIALVTFLTLRLARPGSPDSAYSVWGWRIPFLVGVLLGVAFLVYYARSVRESRVWSSAPKSASPVRDVVFGGSRRQFLQVFVLMSGIWFASNLATGLLPSALQNQGHVSASQVTAALVIVQAVHAALFPYLGVFSERIGRRTFLAWCGVGIAVPCAAAFATIAEGWWSGFAWVVLLTLVIRLAGASAFAVTPSYLICASGSRPRCAAAGSPSATARRWCSPRSMPTTRVGWPPSCRVAGRPARCWCWVAPWCWPARSSGQRAATSSSRRADRTRASQRANE
jgi:MFS family permease